MATRKSKAAKAEPAKREVQQPRERKEDETPEERRAREMEENEFQRSQGRPVAMINTGDGPVTARAPNSPPPVNPAGTPNKNNPTQADAGLVAPEDQDNEIEQIGNTE